LRLRGKASVLGFCSRARSADWSSSRRCGYVDPTGAMGHWRAAGVVRSLLHEIKILVSIMTRHWVHADCGTLGAF